MTMHTWMREGQNTFLGLSLVGRHNQIKTIFSRANIRQHLNCNEKKIEGGNKTFKKRWENDVIMNFVKYSNDYSVGIT